MAGRVNFARYPPVDGGRPECEPLSLRGPRRFDVQRSMPSHLPTLRFALCIEIPSGRKARLD
jgi:hypothetical protein